MKKCKLVQNIMNFKFCYIIFCTIICFIVLSVPTFAKENSDNVIRVGSFEKLIIPSMKREKEAAMVMSIFKILQVMQVGHINT